VLRGLEEEADMKLKVVRSAAPSPAPPACLECSRESWWAVRRCWPPRRH